MTGLRARAYPGGVRSTTRRRAAIAGRAGSTPALAACAVSIATLSGSGAASAASPEAVASPVREPGPAIAWAAQTASPRASVGDGDAATRDRIAELLARCGRGEAGLEEAAQRLVASRLAERRQDQRRGHLDLAALSFSLRAAGEPHVWPHAWVITGRGLDRHATAAKLEAWGATFHEGGERRCGVATGLARDGSEVIAAVALDAVADLAPLPTLAHVGTWLTVDARLVVPVGEAYVIVQGPGSDPRRVPTWTEEADGHVHVRARFSPARPGPITVQVVAEMASGPRPILEASVFADVAPPARFEAAAAPGEDALPARANERPRGPSEEAPSGSDRLVAMVAALRDSERLPPLARDATLDRVALGHARRMMAAHAVGHDVGDGDPEDRLEVTGARARLVGENVAHAASIRLAHRAFYESPSHRANLLRDEFDRVGAAVLDDPDGSVWVAEVFAASR